MSAPPPLDAFTADTVREKPMAWFELCATIQDPKANLITAPDLRANYLQLTEAQVIEWMEAHGLPARVIKLKGRRQGSSTGTLANMAHRLRRTPTQALICGLDYEKNVRVMEEILWRFVDTDRFAWGIAARRRKGKSMSFTNRSAVTLYSANSGTSGRGDQAQFALFTEVAWYPQTEGRDENDLFVALFQLIVREPGTVIVLESTPNGEGGKFHNTWLDAMTFDELKACVASGKFPEGWNGFVKIFQAWHSYPDYELADSHHKTQEVIRDIAGERLTEIEKELVHDYDLSPGRLAWRRDVIAGADFEGDEDRFSVEYPNDEISCFRASGSKYYDARKLALMKEHARDGKTGILRWIEGSEQRQAWFEQCEERQSHVRIFEEPVHGRYYTLTVDTMTGEQANGKDPDNHAPIVRRNGYFDANGQWQPPAVVARLADCAAEMKAKRYAVACRWDVDVLTERVMQLAKLYGNCPVVVEVNKDLGGIELMKKAGHMNIYRRREFNKVENQDKDIYGWLTTQANRKLITESIRGHIRLWMPPGQRGPEHQGKLLDIWDVRIITELQNIVEKENGRVEAGSGSHDDTVLALGISEITQGKATQYVDRVALAQQWVEDDERPAGGGGGGWGM